jgi:hypothetical protein
VWGTCLCTTERRDVNSLAASVALKTVWHKKSCDGLEPKQSWWVSYDSLKSRRTTMKLATIALASVFAVSSTFALATTQTPHHYTSHKYKSAHSKSGVTHQGTVGMGSGAGSNNKGGLVGGADPGTYKP